VPLVLWACDADDVADLRAVVGGWGLQPGDAAKCVLKPVVEVEACAGSLLSGSLGALQRLSDKALQRLSERSPAALKRLSSGSLTAL
jgi:hypothetical protein